MRIRLVSIGNSHGIRLPKAIIQQAGLTPELEMEVGDGKLTLSRIVTPRANWAEDARICRSAGDDVLDDWDETVNDFEGDWE